MQLSWKMYCYTLYQLSTSGKVLMQIRKISADKTHLINQKYHCQWIKYKFSEKGDETSTI